MMRGLNPSYTTTKTYVTSPYYTYQPNLRLEWLLKSSSPKYFFTRSTTSQFVLPLFLAHCFKEILHVTECLLYLTGKPLGVCDRRALLAGHMEENGVLPSNDI